MPALQSIHWPEPLCGLYFPDMQTSQRLEVGNELVPGGQDAHVLDSASDILPALQLMHCVAASALFAARPAEHIAQASVIGTSA